MPEQITIKAGKKLRVEAHVYGKPNPICKWKKGEDEVVTSSHLAIHKADNSSVLIIKDVTRKDSGYYSLTAENSSGTDTQKIKVTVMGRLPVRQVPIKTWRSGSFFFFLNFSHSVLMFLSSRFMQTLLAHPSLHLTFLISMLTLAPCLGTSLLRMVAVTSPTT